MQIFTVSDVIFRVTSIFTIIRWTTKRIALKCGKTSRLWYWSERWLRSSWQEKTQQTTLTAATIRDDHRRQKDRRSEKLNLIKKYGSVLFWKNRFSNLILFWSQATRRGSFNQETTNKWCRKWLTIVLMRASFRRAWKWKRVIH